MARWSDDPDGVRRVRLSIDNEYVIQALDRRYVRRPRLGVVVLRRLVYLTGHAVALWAALGWAASTGRAVTIGLALFVSAAALIPAGEVVPPERDG